MGTPTRLAGRILGPKAQKPFLSRFAERVLPVDASSRPKKDDFEVMARSHLKPYIGQTWKLFYEHFRGGWNTISKEDAMTMCKEVLTADNLSISEPQVTVICTVSPRFVGL